MYDRKRSALYARVSTKDQHTEQQIHDLRECSGRSGFSVFKEYVDHGLSGSKNSRPALDAMMRDAEARKFDVVLCVKLDRLARSVQHLTSLSAHLEAMGIDLVVTSQSIDTSTSSGRLLFHVLSSIAEFERDLIRERTKAGLEAAKRRGKRIGRPERVIDLHAVRSLIEAGETVAEAARRLGVPRTTLARKLCAG